MPAAWFESMGIAATVGAAGLAAAGIWQSKRAADANASRIVLERRVDFELDVLKELAGLVAQDTGVTTRAAQVRTRLQLLPAERVPLCRRHFGLPSTPEADAEHVRLAAGMEPYNVDAELRPVLQEEIVAAITALLARRDL